MFDDETLDKREAGCSDADPIFALIAEAHRRNKIACATTEKADRVLFALPADVRNGEPKILIGHYQFSGEPIQEIYAHDEDDIIRNVIGPNPFMDAHLALLGKTCVTTYVACREVLIAKLHAEQARLDALYAKSGHAALNDQADQREKESSEAFDRVTDCLPTTIEGVIALIQFCDGVEIDHAHLITILRAIAASEMTKEL